MGNTKLNTIGEISFNNLNFSYPSRPDVLTLKDINLHIKPGTSTAIVGGSGSGKSTIANLVERGLHALGRHTYVLDGDRLRHGLNRDLGFGEADRAENVRRISEVAALFTDAGLIVLVSAISPYRADRARASEVAGEAAFLEVFVDTPVEECRRRDPKGLYKQAREAVKAGKGMGFTGVDDPYEAPANPELVFDASKQSLEEGVALVVNYLAQKGLIAG